MRKLHWSTPDNPCLLSGQPVTPEKWIGGVIAPSDPSDIQRWRIVNGLTEDATKYIPGGGWWLDFDDQGEGLCGYHQRACVPLFPGSLWAGKTDAELWAEVVGRNNACRALGFDGVSVRSDGALFALIAEPAIEDWESKEIEDLDALILALQNAQVLAARLKGGAA